MTLVVSNPTDVLIDPSAVNRDKEAARSNRRPCPGTPPLEVPRRPTPPSLDQPPRKAQKICLTNAPSPPISKRIPQTASTDPGNKQPSGLLIDPHNGQTHVMPPRPIVCAAQEPCSGAISTSIVGRRRRSRWSAPSRKRDADANRSGPRRIGTLNFGRRHALSTIRDAGWKG